MNLSKQVRVIAPNPSNFGNEGKSVSIQKVAAYARVSTDQDDQLNSYASQIKEFTQRINENKLWEFAGMYADEGISGTRKANRPEFLKMIEDAKAKKIDLILTKSISRFARNTVECLSIIRELRAIGVEIFFEKENLYSSDSKVDFMLTIFSSIAQEESRNISENIKWGYRKRFKDGKVYVNTKRFLGYDKDENGKLIIDKEEAETIKMIFNLFIAGESITAIANYLTEQNRKNGRGVVNWSAPNIDGILQNEKYCGDAILQKHVVVDYLTHRSVKNNGIVPKYYVSDNHEGIVSKAVFEAVQHMRKNRQTAKANSKYGNQYPLSGLVRCGECGRVLNRHYFNYKQGSQRIVLSCKNTRKNKMECSGKPVDYDTLLEATSDLIQTLQTETPDLVEELMRTLENTLDSTAH
jgi:site-specific DNA recombinase